MPAPTDYGLAKREINLRSGFVVDPVEGVLDEFGRVLEVEFAFDVFAIGLDGAHAQMQFGGDLAGAPPFADQAKNFQFPVGQILDGRHEGLGFATGQLLEHLGLHFVAQENFSQEHAADSHQHLLNGFLFHDVAQASGPQRPLRVKRFIMHGEHQDGNVRKTGFDVLNQFDAIAAFKGNIHHRDIRLARPPEPQLVDVLIDVRERVIDLYSSVSDYGGRPTESQLARMKTLESDIMDANREFESITSAGLQKINADLQQSNSEPIKLLTREEFEKELSSRES